MTDDPCDSRRPPQGMLAQGSRNRSGLCPRWSKSAIPACLLAIGALAPLPAAAAEPPTKELKALALAEQPA
ncbi:MAG: hypothetical protein OXD30_09485, partial [Bryobacterales bacterium]|nr:hypothetical protein [Bryobacterales bacterium]